MEITKNLLKEKFNQFNEKYFENKICDCNFRVEKDNLNLGSFIEKNVSKPIICVSKDDFVNNEIGWTEDRLDNTILHEMIHALIYTRHGITPVIGCHGLKFRLISTKIFLKHGVWIGIGGIFNVIERKWSKLTPMEKAKRILLTPVNWLLMFVF